MTNRAHMLYIGVTNDLYRRVYEHKNAMVPGFTTRYNMAWLAYFEQGRDIRAAIAREKQLKGWTRAKKIALIETMNPEWRDLSVEWYGEEDAPSFSR